MSGCPSFLVSFFLDGRIRAAAVKHLGSPRKLAASPLRLPLNVVTGMLTCRAARPQAAVAG